MKRKIFFLLNRIGFGF